MDLERLTSGAAALASVGAFGVLTVVFLRLWLSSPPTLRARGRLWLGYLLVGTVAVGMFSPAPRYSAASLLFFLFVAVQCWLWKPASFAWARGVFTCPRGVFLAVTGGLFLLGTLLLSWVLFGGLPAVNDSINQYFHAKFLAHGHLSGPSHPLREFFESGWVVNDGRWYSQYPPGHLFALAIGHLVGMPWLVNPLLGTLTLLTLHALGRECYDDKTARVAVLLFLLSPFVLFMSAEYMNHASGLLYATVFLRFYLRAARGGAAWDGAFAGAGAGMLFLTRPLTAVGFLLVFALHALWTLRARFRAHVAAALAFAAFVAVQGWYNAQTTGSVWVYAYERATGGSVPLGFDAAFGVGQGVANAFARVVVLNLSLFHWPVASLLPALLALLWSPRDRRDLLFLGAFAGVVGIYVFWRFDDLIFGPRYLYETVTALTLVTAHVLMRAATLPWVHRLGVERLGVLSVLGLFLVVFPVVLPTVLSTHEPFSRTVDQHVYRRIVREVKTPALVLVAPDSRHERLRDGLVGAMRAGNPGKLPIFVDHVIWLRYIQLSHANPPTGDAPVIFARDLENRNASLISFYCDRFVYGVETDAPILISEPVHGCRPGHYDPYR